MSYEQRVHRVIDHIRAHLSDDLELRDLAKVACFSPYHFHRIFKSVTGETVAQFTRRARLERAVFLMRGSNRDLTSIALEVGFGTPSDFSRVFRRCYGVAPSSWDRVSRLDGGVDFATTLAKQGVAPASGARITERPAQRLAYIRVRNPWQGDSLAIGFDRLQRWFAERELNWKTRQLVGLSWDSEKATPIERLVYDLGLTVDESVRADGEIGVHRLPAVRAVELHCKSLPETAVAWEFLYRDWLPTSGFEPDDIPATKRFRRTPEVFDDEAWDVDCSIAIRRSRD